MKPSSYVYAFEHEGEYVLYSWLADRYVNFPIGWRRRVEEIPHRPDDVRDTVDGQIYSRLVQAKILVPDAIDEYALLLEEREGVIHASDAMRLTILPTLNCNCRCPYCYESHPVTVMTSEVVESICQLIRDRAKRLSFLGIVWFGGEPLLCPEIVDEIGQCARDVSQHYGVSYEAGMTSNGFLLNERAIEILKRTGVSSIQVTLDGSRERHDRTRVLAGGGPTFDVVVENVKNYLHAHPEHKVAIRIHLHGEDEEEVEGILKHAERFQGFEGRVAFYFRTLYTSHAEEWEAGSRRECELEVQKEPSALVRRLVQEMAKRGFMQPIFAGRRYTYCEADLRNAFVVRPDGYVTRCTVAIERERAIGKLTRNGIQFFNVRRQPFDRKILLEREYCRGCQFLPWCWGHCAFQNVMNDEDALKHRCKKAGGSLILQEVVEGLKVRYQQKRLQGGEA